MSSFRDEYAEKMLSFSMRAGAMSGWLVVILVYLRCELNFRREVENLQLLVIRVTPTNLLESLLVHAGFYFCYRRCVRRSKVTYIMSYSSRV